MKSLNFGWIRVDNELTNEVEVSNTRWCLYLTEAASSASVNAAATPMNHPLETPFHTVCTYSKARISFPISTDRAVGLTLECNQTKLPTSGGSSVVREFTMQITTLPIKCGPGSICPK